MISNKNFNLAIYSSLFYCLPLVVWTISQTAYTQNTNDWNAKSWADVTQEGLKILWIVQALIIAIVIPWLSWHKKWRHQISTVLILILMPLPLLSIVWLSGGSTLSALTYGLISLVILSALLLLSTRLIENLPPSHYLKVSGRVIIQILSVSILWKFHEPLLSWVNI